MSAFAGIVGSGAAVIVIGVIWVSLKHYHNLPSTAHPWICRALIVLAVAAGAVLVVTPLGSWTLNVINDLGAHFGGLDYGTLHVAVVVGGLMMLLAVVVSLIWAPDDGTALNAIALPLVLALPASGALHTVYLDIHGGAVSLVAMVAGWVGG